MLVLTQLLVSHPPLSATVAPARSEADSLRSAHVLTPGTIWTDSLADGESRSYRLGLDADEFVELAVEQTFNYPVLEITDPSGQRVLEASWRTASFVAAASGVYRVALRANERTAPSGRFAIVVGLTRTPEPQDLARAAGHQAVSEARPLLAEGKAASTAQAVEKLTSAAALFEQAGDHASQAFALWSIADSMQDRRPAALEYAKQALAAARQTDDRWVEAMATRMVGASQFLERDKGLDSLQQALMLFEGIGDPRGQALTLTSIGFARADLSEYKTAIDLWEKAIALATAIGDRSLTATTYNNIGYTRVNLGELPEALESLNRALALVKTTRNQTLEMLVVNNMGIAYKELGDYRRALDHYKQTLAFVEESGSAFRRAQVLNNIGNVYKAQNDNERALEYYNLALPLFRETGNKGGEAIALNNIGSAYSQMNQPERALPFHQQSRDIRRAINDRSGESSALTQAGIALRKLGRLDEAIESLRESLRIRRQLNEPLGESDTLLNLAAAVRDSGNLAAARTTIEEALDITERLRARIADVGLRASYVARVQDTYASYVDVLMRLHTASPRAGHDAEALQAAERTRARVLLESLVEARTDLSHDVDASLLQRMRTLESSLDASGERLSRALSGGKNGEAEAIKREIETLSDEYQRVQTQVRASSPRYAALTQPEALTAAQIQREVLDDSTVLLEFALGDERSWLWAVTPSTITSVELAGREELESAARSFYAELTARQPRDGENPIKYAQRVAAADRRVRDRAAVVSQMLFGGVADRLEGTWRGKRLMIVAAGALEYLPFAALPVPHGAKAAGATSPASVSLIAHHEVVEAPSASVLATLRREAAARTPARREVAVFADPVFEPRDPRVASVPRHDTSVVASESTDGWRLARAIHQIDGDAKRSGLSRLPFSREEANAIAALAGERETLRAIDFQASRATALGGALADYRIVHFATHGLIDSERPELSGLILSLVNDRGRAQDGFLRRDDIFKMRLNADLVVLSACRTALGQEIKGEGLVGLTRGFMYAGAPRVVASLWQVSDLGTAELMKKFYAAMLQRRLPPAAALRRAQLQMARDPQWASPYFWAGFVLQGDWN